MSQYSDINAASSEGEVLHCRESPGDANEVKNLKHHIGELERSLTLTKAKLTETESRLQQQIEQREVPIDFLENEDVRKLVDNYKTDIKALEEKLKCVSSNETATRIAEENQKLKKRNQILLSTNTDFVAKYTALSAQLVETEKERDKIKAVVEVSQSTGRTRPLQCHPGGDIGVVTEPLPPKEGVVKNSCSEKDPSVAELQKYLGEYYTLLQQSRSENSVLLHQLQRKQRVVIDTQAQMKKFAEQMVLVVQERDENRTTLEKMRKGMGQGGHAANNVPLETEFSKKLHVQGVYTKQHKHLLAELTEKLKYKEDHILEQEAKIEKLIIRCSGAEKDRDAYTQENNPLSNSQMGVQVDPVHKIISEREAELERMRHIFEELQEKHSELTNELDQLKSNKNPDTFFYNEQLKAFQEDYIAEREEKKRIIEESRRLHENNKHLRLELQTRSSSQGHFSPPPPGPSPSFEPLHPQSPPISISHQPPPVPGQSLQPMPPPRGTVPNSGLPVYHTSYPREYRRANTIPPRSHADPHGQYQYNYHPEQQFYPNYEVAREVNPGYQSMYFGPSSTIPHPRAPNAGSPQDRQLQDRRAPR